jgi:ABC-2 type transport system permease protein
MTTSAASSLSMTARIGRVISDRAVLWTLVRRDLRVRYARSVLGYLWTLVDPLAMAFVYYLVFAVIFQRHEVLGMPFIVFLLAGLLPWTWFNNSINETTRSLYTERLLVRSTNVPRELWVIRVVIAKGIEHLLSLPILGMFVAIYTITGAMTPNWRVVFIVPALLLELTLLTGLGLVMAPVTALVDDFQRLVRIGLRVMFYCTPVIYELALVEERAPALLPFLRLNPLSGIIDLYRVGLVGIPVDWISVTLSVVISLACLVLGLWTFARLERPVLKEI